MAQNMLILSKIFLLLLETFKIVGFLMNEKWINILNRQNNWKNHSFLRIYWSICGYSKIKTFDNLEILDLKRDLSKEQN